MKPITPIIQSRTSHIQPNHAVFFCQISEKEATAAGTSIETAMRTRAQSDVTGQQKKKEAKRRAKNAKGKRMRGLFGRVSLPLFGGGGGGGAH